MLEQSGAAKKLTGQILESWLVALADGHGGIQTISKTSTTGSNPVVDTYTITYADTTSSTFTVTNGVKGDQGDTWYTWIKYSSVEPTQDSDMGDIPDDWMGVYVGTSSTAPTTYTSYTWYEIKGNTGAPSTLSSSSVSYQAGSTGTVVPSGEWEEEPPVVTPGNYLWAKTVLTFNTGDPVTVYSVARQGVDGEGAAGLATPLINVSGGSVGEGTSFSREDHQHPLTTLHLQATITTLPTTISNAAITADMRVINCVITTPTAITSDLSWATSAGSLALSGTMATNGSTVIDIDLDTF